MTCIPPRRTTAVSCAFILLLTSAIPLTLSAQEDSVDPVATREYAVALGFQKKKLYEQAAARWTQFMAKHAGDKRLANAHFHLGVCQLRSGKPETAATFRQHLQKFPKFEQRDAVQLNLGLALYTSAVATKKPEDFKAAAAEFAKLPAQFAQSPHAPSALYYQAECVFQGGDPAAAVGIYQTLVQKHAGSPLVASAMFALATTQQELDKNAEAVQTYRTFLQKFGNDSRVAEGRLRLGLALTSIEKHAEAEREFSTATAVKDFQLADLALFHQARSKYLQNQLTQAADLFESLPKKFPNSAYLAKSQLEAGKCRFQANQFSQAKTVLTAVVNSKTNESAEAAWWLGRTLIQLKQAAASLPILDAAINAWPQSEFVPDLNFTRIEAIYEDAKRRPETVALYSQFADKFATDELAADARYRAALTALQLSDVNIAMQQADAFLANGAFAKHALFPDALFISAESRIVGDAPDFAKAETAYRRLVTEFTDHEHAQRSSVRIGFCLHSQKKHDPAIGHLNAVLPKLKDPELKAEALFLAGLAHSELNRAAEAVKSLQASRAAKGDWVRGDEVLLALADAFRKTNQPDAAIAELNRLNQQYSKSEFGDRAWFRLGETHAEKKQYDQAVAAFQQVPARYPTSELISLAIYGSASAFFDKADHNNAINQLNTLLTKHAASEIAANGFYLRGLSYHRQTKHAEAVRDLSEFLKRNPSDEQSRLDAQYSLALCHAGLKQHDQTIQIATALLKAKPDYSSADKVLYELAFAYSETNKAKESSDTFRQLGTKFPDSELAPESWLRVAEYHTTQSQFVESAAACDQGLAKAKDAVLRERLLFRKGSSQFAAEKYADGTATLQMQIKDHAAGEFLIDATWLVAESVYRQKKQQEALPWYQKVIAAKSPKYHARALYRSGTCASDLSQWPAAQQHFEALTKQFPEFEQVNEALYGLGFALQNQNQLDRASQTYEQVTQKTNTESAAKARFMMGECAFAQKKYDMAWQHFLEAALGYPYPEWQALGHFEAGRCFIELKMPEKAREALQTVVDKHPQHVRAKDAAKLLANLKVGG